MTATRYPKLRAASAKADASRSALELQIRLAHDEGMSLRAIASAAGLSHETVRRIVQAGIRERDGSWGTPYEDAMSR